MDRGRGLNKNGMATLLTLLSMSQVSLDDLLPKQKLKTNQPFGTFNVSESKNKKQKANRKKAKSSKQSRKRNRKK